MTDQPQIHGGEIAVMIALGVLVLIGALVWSSTGLAGVVFGGGWPRMSLSALARALTVLPGHLSDPRQAWPASARAGMSGPAGFYVTVAILLAGAAGVIAAIWRAHQAGILPTDVESKGNGARWGSAQDLGALRVSRWPKRRGASGGGRLALGYQGRRLLRGEARHALVLFGPPQSGKSAGIAIPSLLEWEGPAVASSIKTDLYAASVRRREALGEVMVFDPYGLSPAPGSTWSPLHAARTWDGALSTAMRMTAGAEIDTGAVKGGGYWQATAEQRLAPLLWAAAQTGGQIASLVRWAHGQGDAELPNILHQLLANAPDARTRADAEAAHDAHLAFGGLAGDTRSSIESTVQLLVRAYRSPRVQASARSCQITPERLLSGPHTLYLIGDAHRSKLLRPLFLALLQELLDHAYHQATLRGGRLSSPLLLCLDELGNVAPLPNLAEIASTAPSHNIQLVSVFHDLAQAKSRYGEQARTVINSHRARMLLPGVADLETLRYFSDLLGDQDIREKDLSGQPTTKQRRPLASPERLRQLKDNQALLIYGRLAPAKLRLRLHYRDRRLKALAQSSIRQEA